MFRDRILMTTLAVSFLVHVSMVTLFSIYVWVPVNRPRYAQLEIKYRQSNPLTLAGLVEPLKVPRLDVPMPESDLTLPQPPQPELTLGAPRVAKAEELPTIAVPTLDPAQLERWDMIASSLQARSAFEPEPERDLWAQSIGQLGRIGDRLRIYTPFESVFDEEGTRPRPTPIARPAEGIAIYVEWTGEPHDRELMLPPSVDAFWGLDAKAVRRPMSVPFKANAAGNVVLAAPPAGDEMLARLAESLLQLRFAPLEESSAGDQVGLLIVAPESAP
ncbi:MAG: hypothetical protein HUU46_10245 [Candidatus Hydrogenedentes bacterium]|nr:hypothetical protein [Candidatus Hydrogenedentota bacterium]